MKKTHSYWHIPQLILFGIICFPALFLSANLQAQNGLKQDFESFTIGHKLPTMGWDNASASSRVAEVVADPVSASNKVLRFTPGDYNALPVVSFTIPEGKKLSDYTSFTFRGRFSAGDVGWKDIFVAAYGTQPAGGFQSASAPLLGQVYRNSGPSNNWETVTIQIPNTSTLTGTVYIAFGMSTAASANGGNTTWFVDDVELIGPTGSGGGGGGSGGCTEDCPFILQDFESFAIGHKLATMGWDNASASSRVAEVVADPVNASNKVLRFTPGDYNALPVLSFTIPAGKTLADYTSFTFQGRFSAGDVGWKDIFVAAYGTQPTGGFQSASAPLLGQVYRNAGPSSAWETVTVEIPNTSTLTGTVYIAFGMSTAASESGSATTWFADDVKLIAGSGSGGGGNGNGGGTGEPCTTDCANLFNDFESYNLNQKLATLGHVNAEAIIVADPLNASNKVLRFKPGGSYAGSVPVLEFTLPQGRRLSEYTQITFRARLNDGDVGHKTFFAGAFQNAPSGSFDFGTTPSYYIGQSASTGAASPNWRDITINIPNSKNLTGKIYIAMGMQQTDSAIWYIDDIRLVGPTTPSGSGGGNGGGGGGTPGATVNVNGDFSNSTIGQTSNITNWLLEGTNFASYQIVEDPDQAGNKVLRVSITNMNAVPDNQAWAIQPLHVDYDLVEGRQYKVSARIKVGNSVTGTPHVGLDPGNGAGRYQVNIASGGSAWQTIETNTFTFAAGGTEYTGLHFGYKGLNSTGDIFYIDDLKVVEVGGSGGGNGGGGSTCTSDCPFIGQDFMSFNVGHTFPTMGWGQTPATATVVADPANASNKVLRFVPGDYNALPVVALTIPAGKTLADYTTFTFRGRFSAGDVGWKTIYVAAYGSAPSGAFEEASAPVIGSFYRNAGPSSAWETITVSVPNTSTLTGTVHLAFGMSTAGSESGATTEWFADDIKLIAGTNAGGGGGGNGGGGGGTPGATVNVNGDFSNSTIGQTSNITNWLLEGTNFASYQIVEDPDQAGNKVLRLTITNMNAVPDNQAWAIQPLHVDYDLVEGRQYKVSARIKVGNSVTGTPHVGLDPGNGAGRYQVNIASGGSAWQTIETNTFTFAAGGTEYTGLHFGYKGLNSTGDIFYIDDLKVVDMTDGGGNGGGGNGGGGGEPPVPGVVNVNGNFETATIGQTTGILNWILEGPNYADYIIAEDPNDPSNKVLKITIKNVQGVTNAWDIQPLHVNFELIPGQNYKVSARVKAVAGPGATPTIGLDPGNAVGRYGLNISSAGSNWFTYETGMFTYQTGGEQQVGLHFGYAANTNGTVFYIDDIEVILIAPSGGGGPTGEPLAKGHTKFLGNVYSGSQLVDFNQYWNQVTPENAGKWGSVESSRGNFNWTQLDAAYDLAKSNGFPFRFHVLVWGSQQPSWMTNLSGNPSEQLQAIDAWFRAVAQRYPDIDYLEVVNEPLHDKPDAGGGRQDAGNYIQALGGAGSTGWDWVIKAFEMARDIFPASTKLMINEYNILNSQGNALNYVNIINLLKDRDLIDVIGVQGHAFSTRGSANSMRNILNILGATGLPIQVTEMDVDGNPTQSPNMTMEQSDQEQLDAMRRIFTALWDHPSVEGITMWGWRPGLWRDPQQAHLVRSNGEERPALVWIRTFLQERLVSIDSPVETTIPATFSLSNNYPNPFNPTTQISYELSEQVSVVLRVYDVTGRLVQTLVQDTQAPGRYTVSFNASNLASGVYIYRIQAGNYHEAKMMMLVK